MFQNGFERATVGLIVSIAIDLQTMQLQGLMLIFVALKLGAITSGIRMVNI